MYALKIPNKQLQLVPAAPLDVEIKTSVPWMVSRVFDLLFVCGGAPWLCAVLAWLVLGSVGSGVMQTPAQHGLTLFYIAVSLLVGESHQFTSIVRLYFKGLKWKMSWGDRLPFVCLYGGAVLTVLMAELNSLPFATQKDLQAGFAPILMSLENALFVVNIIGLIAMVLFPVALMNHFSAQAFGVMMIYCARTGYKLSASEVRCLRLSMLLLTLAGAASIALPFLIGDMAAPQFHLAFDTARYAFGLLALLLFAVPVARRAVVRSECLPMPAILVWLNLAAYVLLPMKSIVYVWLFVPVLFHATQHWTVAWRAQQREAEREGRSGAPFAEVLRLALPVQVLTLAVLFFPLWMNGGIVTPHVGAEMTLPVTWSMWIFYLHYFADRVVWRPHQEVI